MTKCPKCDLQWEPPCDQTACIELFCECISCRRFKLTEDEIKQIQTSAALERKAENARELGLDYYVPCCTDQTCPKCKSALEAKDEPVEFFDWYNKAHWGNEDFKEGCHRSWNAAIKYTTPPQRTWVGLTDEEISELIRATHNTGSFVRAIEAKLKQKNFKE